MDHVYIYIFKVFMVLVTFLTNVAGQEEGLREKGNPANSLGLGIKPECTLHVHSTDSTHSLKYTIIISLLWK